MAWTVRVIKDPTKDNVGTAIATWNEGLPDEFVFSALGDTTQIDLFVWYAKQSLIKRNMDREVENEKTVELLTKLNDPFFEGTPPG